MNYYSLGPRISFFFFLSLAPNPVPALYSVHEPVELLRRLERFARKRNSLGIVLVFLPPPRRRRFGVAGTVVVIFCRAHTAERRVARLLFHSSIHFVIFSFFSPAARPRVYRAPVGIISCTSHRRLKSKQFAADINTPDPPPPPRLHGRAGFSGSRRTVKRTDYYWTVSIPTDRKNYNVRTFGV